MATFKALVRAHQKRRDGTYCVSIRVTHKGKHKYMATGLYAGKEDVTKSLKIKNSIILDATEATIKEYRTRCNELGVALEKYDVKQLCEILKAPKTGEWHVSFFDYAEKVIATKSEGTAKTYRAAVGWLRRYAGDEVALSDISKKFISGLLKYIDTHKVERNTKKQGDSIPFAVIHKIKSIYKEARKEFNDEELGVIHLPFNPFEHIEVKSGEAPEKRAISVEKIRELSVLHIDDGAQPLLSFSRDVFLLSFALMGANIADMYEWRADQYKGGRITYKRKKTRARRADGALISVKVQPEILPLLEKYADPDGVYLFDFVRRYNGSNNMSWCIAPQMKRIGKLIGEEDLTFYAARHSWATIALNDAGVDKYTVHEGLNHAGGAMAITDVYIKKDWTRLDKANRAVLDFVQLPPLGKEGKKNPSSEEADEGEPNKITRNNKGD